MSSPIAKSRKSAVDHALIAVHQKISHQHRIEILAAEFASRFALIKAANNCEKLRVLDVGCGDMTLTDAVVRQLPDCRVQCVDVHPCPPNLAAVDNRWDRYTQFDGSNLPFGADEFDVAFFSDVLHHVPKSRLKTLIKEAGRVAHKLVIKDHFEYGFWSRHSLRLMDFVGNFGYGVSVPDEYFTPHTFAVLCAEAGLQQTSIDVGLQLYGHIPLVKTLLSPNWHFIATCQTKTVVRPS